MNFSPALNLRRDHLASLDAASSVSGSDTVYVVQSGAGKRATRDQLLAGWAGSNAITTLGTISTGVWQGAAIDKVRISGTGAWAVGEIPNLPASIITSGTIDSARLGSGTANSTTFLRGDSSWQTVTSASGANPTGTIGLSAVNGVATTFLRSDAAPALSQAITPTWTNAHTFAAATTWFGAAAQAATLRQVAPASGAGNGLTIRGDDAASGNTNGGSVLLLPGAKSGSGSNGTVIVRQPGGTPGSHEIQFSHDASNGLMEAKAGGLIFKANTGGVIAYFQYGGSTAFRVNYNAACLDQTISLGWGNGATTPTVEIKRLANGVFGVADGAATAGGSGYDTTLRLVAKSSTTADTSRFDIATAAVDNTHATRKYRAVFNAYDTAARECMRVEASGTAPMIGFYGVSATARQILATGAGATVDDVITALQTLGLVRQS